MNWLNIVPSALSGVHHNSAIVEVILGEQTYVNTEAPDAIAGLIAAERPDKVGPDLGLRGGGGLHLNRIAGPHAD